MLAGSTKGLDSGFLPSDIKLFYQKNVNESIHQETEDRKQALKSRGCPVAQMSTSPDVPALSVHVTSQVNIMRF